MFFFGSGAFHTQLMEPAVDPFREALKMMRLSAPRIPVYSNVKNQIYTKPDQVKYLLMLIDYFTSKSCNFLRSHFFK